MAKRIAPAAALARQAEKGERVGQVPYGKMLSADGVHLIDHPTEQAVTAMVRALRADGMSLRGMAAELNRREMTNRAGGAFKHTQVVRMLEAA
jgi:catabolite regulation protein CreA